MTWISNKKNIDTSGGRIRHTSGRPPQPERSRRFERLYKVSEVAGILNVTKATVMGWLEYEEGRPETAVIHKNFWFRLPNGHIRIREAAVLKLQGLE